MCSCVKGGALCAYWGLLAKDLARPWVCASGSLAWTGLARPAEAPWQQQPAALQHGVMRATGTGFRLPLAASNGC